MSERIALITSEIIDVLAPDLQHQKTEARALKLMVYGYLHGTFSSEDLSNKRDVAYVALTGGESSEPDFLRRFRDSNRERMLDIFGRFGLVCFALGLKEVGLLQARSADEARTFMRSLVGFAAKVDGASHNVRLPDHLLESGKRAEQVAKAVRELRPLASSPHDIEVPAMSDATRHDRGGRKRRFKLWRHLVQNLPQLWIVLGLSLMSAAVLMGFSSDPAVAGSSGWTGNEVRGLLLGCGATVFMVSLVSLGRDRSRGHKKSRSRRNHRHKKTPIAWAAQLLSR